MAGPFPTIPYTVDPLTEAESLERAEAFFDVMDARRSVREFSDRPVPRALIDAVLKANPGLAGQGALLPAGLRIALPEFAEDPDTASVRLWD